MVLSLGQFLIGLSKPLDWIVVLGSISVEEEERRLKDGIGVVLMM